MSALLDLAKRCEEATGPDRELDGQIWIACLADAASRKAYIDGLAVSQSEADWRLDYMMGGFCPTSSLDAAMTLVPEGMGWFVSTTGPEDDERPYALVGNPHTETDTSKGASAATPALALTAAALRARAAMGEA